MRNKLTHKVNGAILATFLLIAVTYYAIETPFQKRRHDSSMEKIKTILITMVERDSEPLAHAIFENRMRAVSFRVGQMAQTDQILEICVFDSSGTLLVSHGLVRECTDLSPGAASGTFTPNRFLEKQWASQLSLRYDEDIETFGERVGQIQIYYSLAEVMNDERSAFLISGGLLVAILLIMLVLLNLILSNAIINPIVSLQKAAGLIAEGKLDTNIPTQGNDELGALAESFVDMRDAIATKIQDLEQLNLNLEHKVTERTEKLVEAKQTAEQANLAKSLFLANMSHEIRTPLNAVLGLTTLMLKTELSDEQRDSLGKIQSAGRLLLDNINDVLDLSKIEAGRMEIHASNFDLEDILTDLEDVAGVNATEKGVAMVVDVATDVPLLLHGDFVRLRQVLLNLTNNAVKFTDHGEVVVRVDHLRTSDGRITLVFSVRDTGIGIASHQIAKLFEPFTQADTSTTRKYGGTGLGLAISRSLVRMMDGDMWVTSESGRGSTFTFTAAFTSSRTDASTRESSEIPNKPIRRLSSRLSFAKIRFVKDPQVLLAEDNAINQEVARGLLEGAGVTVVTAANGVEALHALEKDPFDAVLMDIQMPEMDGIEATHAIRSNASLRGIPIIAMTAHAMLGDEERFLQAGMNDYVAKPVQEANLMQVLSKWLPFELDTTVETETIQVLPDSIPGIDVANALKRVNGKTELFATLVDDFREENRALLNRLRRAIDEAQHLQAAEMLHALKGASATIGATGVAHSAAALEDALRRSASWSEPWVELEKELSVVLDGVREKRRAPPPTDPGSGRARSVDLAEAFRLFMELRQHLYDNNLDAGRAFDKVRNFVADCGHDGQLATLGASIDALDFDAAARHLNELARALSLPLPSERPHETV